MRIFFDTEFTTLRADQDPNLISAGFISEDGQHEFYAEISNFPREQASPFVLEAVLPLLDAPASQRLSYAMFGCHLVEWLAGFGEPVELCTDYAGDWYLIHDAIGDLIAGLPHPVSALFVRADSEVEKYSFWQQPENKGKQHHALFDARCLRVARLAHERREKTADDRPTQQGERG